MNAYVALCELRSYRAVEAAALLGRDAETVLQYRRSAATEPGLGGRAGELAAQTRQPRLDVNPDEFGLRVSS